MNSLHAKKDACLEKVHLPLLRRIRKAIATNTNRAIEDLQAAHAPSALSGSELDMYRINFRTRLFHHFLPVIVGGSAIQEHLSSHNLKPIGWITDDIDVKISAALRLKPEHQDDIKMFRLLFIKHMMTSCTKALESLKEELKAVDVQEARIHLRYGKHTIQALDAPLIKELAEGTNFKRFTLSTIHVSYKLASGEEVLFPIMDVVIFASQTTHTNMWKDYLRESKRIFIGSVPAFARNIGWCSWDGFTYIGNLDYLILDTIRMLHNADVVEQLVRADPTLTSTIDDTMFKTFVSNTKKYPKYWIKLLQLLHLHRTFVSHVPYSHEDMHKDMRLVKETCAPFLAQQVSGALTPKQYMETLIQVHQKMKQSEVFRYISDMNILDVVDRNIKKVFKGGDSSDSAKKALHNSMPAEDQRALDEWRITIDPDYESYEAHLMAKQLADVASKKPRRLLK